ncbi:TolC family protein [Saccharobesus litoralis]|uniref:TolC family protein n=1 Tax=Saccharobesus litoralis TaxID=2172099 RepID=A0A2S0VUM1_9ALTE|nr:TolC family protein [Saccharobesus litoralis]AWB67895.1 TolC family protein [Saccharobesus litoralis]
MNWSYFKAAAFTWKKVKRLLMLSFLVTTNNVFANDLSVELVSLSDAIQRTFVNNPQLTAFEYKQQRLEGELATAGLKPEYNVNVELENFAGTGDVSGFNQAELTLSISSVVELGDKVDSRKFYVNTQKQAVAVAKRIQTLDILGEVTTRYIDVLTLQQVMLVNENAEKLAQETYQTVSKKARIGSVPTSELRRAEASLATAKLKTLTISKQLEASIRKLAIMWGEQSPQFSRVSGDLFTFPNTISLEYIMAQLSQSPHILAYAEQSRIQQAQLQSISTRNQANITWSAGVKRLEGSNDTALVAGFSVPLFTSERNRGNYQSQKAKLDEVEQKKKASERAIYSQLATLYAAQEEARLTVETLQTNIIPPQESALSLVQKAYSDGRYSYLELVSVQKELIDMQYALIFAASKVHKQSAAIEALSGIPLISSGNTVSQLSSFSEN